jgi:hypothetical protein
MAGWRCKHYILNNFRDILEADLVPEKCGYGDLVGGIEGNGFSASGGGGFVS